MDSHLRYWNKSRFVSAKLGRFDLVLSWHRNEPNPISFRDIRMSCEPFITTINIHHIYHKRQSFQASDSVYSGRISSIPDGYRLFRTDIISSGRILFIPSGCRTSEAFQAHLYSSAVFPVLDRTRHQFTSIPHFDQTPKVSQFD